MKIYTSYFGNIKNIPERMVPISIAGKPPDFYRGLEYKALAPKLWFFREWKENHDEQEYISCYEEYVLKKLIPEKVAESFSIAARDRDVVLLCYEKPGSFCHRHLVADWFRKSGIEVEEL